MVKKGTVSSKGQITLPKVLREKYHFNDGETVVILDSGDGVLIKHTRETLRGLLKGEIDADKFERELKKLRKEWIA